MGSDPTLAQQRGSRRDRHDDQPDDRYALGGRQPLLVHLQTAAALGGHEFGDWPESEVANGFRGDLAAPHRHDHTHLATDFPHTHPERTTTLSRAEGEQAFDRLNPEFGVPADHHDRIGHRDAQQREHALALGPRVAVAAMRENDRDPAIWLAGQDYRVADAARTARQQPARVRREPARAGAER
jgi:hypothetical protein